MNQPVVGFAICGSFCTYDAVFRALEDVKKHFENIVPIMSPYSASTDTRFGKAKDFTARLKELCGREIITTIEGAEPIGPKKLLDLLVIAPCTGNTLAKLAQGITDTPVAMAYKAHLRNSRPVLIAVSSNDALSANAHNLGVLLDRKNNYFVPFRQDDPVHKPCSLVADFSLLPEAMEAALRGEQLQPLLRLA